MLPHNRTELRYPDVFRADSTERDNSTPKRRLKRSPTDPHFSPDEHLPRNRDIVPHRRRLNTSPNNRPKSPILDRAINSYRDRLNTTPLDRRPNSFNLDHRNQETHTPSFLFSRFDGRNNHLRPHYSLDSLLTPPRERRNIAGRHNFADRRDFAHSSDFANRYENGSDKRRTSIRAMDLAVRRKKRESIYEEIPADKIPDEFPPNQSGSKKDLARRLKSSIKKLVKTTGTSSTNNSTEHVAGSDTSSLRSVYRGKRTKISDNKSEVSSPGIEIRLNDEPLNMENLNMFEKSNKLKSASVNKVDNSDADSTKSGAKHFDFARTSALQRVMAELKSKRKFQSEHIASEQTVSGDKRTVDGGEVSTPKTQSNSIPRVQSKNRLHRTESKTESSNTQAKSIPRIQSNTQLQRTNIDTEQNEHVGLENERVTNTRDLDSRISKDTLSPESTSNIRKSESSRRPGMINSRQLSRPPILEEERASKTEGESTSGDSGLFFPVPETHQRKHNKPKPIKPGVKIEESADEIDEGHYKFDVAKIIPKDRVSSSETFESFLKFLRVLIYFLIFVLLLTSLTSSMGAFLLLEAAVLKDQEHRWHAQSQLLWIVCAPNFLIFVTSFGKCLFGSFEWPNFKLLCVLLIVELLHCFGVALLVFRVLPHFGSFFALGIINCIAVIPVLLKIAFTRLDEKSIASSCSFSNVMGRLMDLVCLVVQIGIFVLPIWMDDNIDQFWKDELYILKWQLPLAVVCLSIKWWENFVNKNIWFCHLKDLKMRFHSTRYTSSIVTSTLNIVMTTAFMYLFEYIYSDRLNVNHYMKPPLPDGESVEYFDTSDNDSTDDQFSNNATGTAINGINPDCKGFNCTDDYLSIYTPCVVVILGSLVAFYLAGLACKLLMQAFSFSLPTILSTPLVLVWMILRCQDTVGKVSPNGLHLEFICNKSNYQIIFLAFIWWLSLVWITRHIWSPDIDRLALNERIFINLMYCGPFVTQSLMLNRRNDHQDKLMELHFSNDNDFETEYSKTQYSDDKDITWESKKHKRVVPKIYACGTMWHETRNEMVQLLKSVMRMDIDQNCREIAEDFFRVIDPDFYEFEAHIFFDDCMDIDENDKWIPNKFVIQFIDCLDEAASSVHKEARELKPPIRITTPYGGQLAWTLPCGNRLTVHLKDKNKIRHRKRWSQVMYMYYLLGYRLFEEPHEEIEEMLKEKLKRKYTQATLQTEGGESEPETNSSTHQANRLMPGFGRSDIFQDMSYRKLQEAENTFILALDGDVDFKPEAVKLLIDRMKVNPKVGAACGRIHPIGSGPLVWYQQFEYAIGHWFQKATEHILGCVLCSPGCFSLFRGSALLDDNVMRRYATEPEEAAHYIQYDQGEDRWLCTLLLQQGYRIDYSAASDALTYAPETFNEFFNQRRRWTPSTIANNIDLLGDSKNVIMINSNISYLYMAYQFVLIVAMVLGPSTITLAISTAFLSVFEIELWHAYALSLAPVVFYITVCFKCKISTQLAVAAVLSAFYACIMTIVLVGIIQTIVSQSFLNPSLLFLGMVASSFVFSALIHPYEFDCIVHGFLYYLCIPAGYLILMIYSISNLHVVSWGTREVKKRKSKAQMAREQALEERRAAEKAKKKGNILQYLRLDAVLKEFKDSLTQIFSRTNELSKKDKTEKYMKKMLKEMRKMRLGNQYIESSDSEDDKQKIGDENANSKQPEVAPEVLPPEPEVDEEEIEIKPDDPVDPNFIKDTRLGNGPFMPLGHKEDLFFKRLIKKYLTPIKKDAKKQKAMSDELLSLRNNCSFGFWFMNSLWVLFNYMINRESKLNVMKIYGYETQPLGFVFIIFFMLVLFLQVIGMIMHRWNTFLQLLSIVELKSPIRHKQLQDSGATITPTEALKIVAEVQKSKSIFTDGAQVADSDSETYHVINPAVRTKRLIENTRKLVDRNRELEHDRHRKRRHRNHRKQDHVIEVDRSYQDRHSENRDRHGDERIDREIERFNRDRQRQRRESINYRSTMTRHFNEQYGHLGDVRRRRTAMHNYRYGESDIQFAEIPRLSKANSRLDLDGRLRRANNGLKQDDVNIRARRRLNGLARDRYR